MIMLDTNTCSYVMRDANSRVQKQFEPYAFGELFISSIVRFELAFGYYNQPSKQLREKLERFLSKVQIMPFDEEAAELAGQLRARLKRAGTPISGFDVLIGAHALAHDATLVTNNIREFSRIEGLRLEDWTK
jgi:tRNA(fMet)-specific endonuclease VapC